MVKGGQKPPGNLLASLHALGGLRRDVTRSQLAEMKARAHRTDWDRLTSEQRDIYARECSIARLRHEGYTITRPPDGFVPIPMSIDRVDDE
jgi:hypothetical protein